MGSWCYDALDELKEFTEGHTTAYQVLLFFCSINRICIQDAVAMAVLHPERQEHCLYTIPCFRRDDFTVSFEFSG